MAEQNRYPGPWDDSMSDGCSGVCDFGFKVACVAHDKANHFGGTIEDKANKDDDFYDDMCATSGFWGWVARLFMARERWVGVKFFTYNYPPGHPKRQDAMNRVEAWNWLPAYPDGYKE